MRQTNKVHLLSYTTMKNNHIFHYNMTPVLLFLFLFLSSRTYWWCSMNPKLFSQSVCLSVYLSVCQTVLSVYFDGQTDKTADRLTFSVCLLFDLFARQLIRLFCLSVSQSVCRSVWCLFFRLPLQNGKLTKAEFVSWMRRHPLIVDSVFQHSSIKDKQFNTGLQVSNELGVSRAWKELCMINSNNDL